MQTHAPERHPGGPLLRHGVVSIVILLLAFAALDDVTTDNSADFTAEYTMLVSAALWFGFVAVGLIRHGHRALGMTSLVVLPAALWAQRGIGPGLTPGWWPEYLVMTAALSWFVALTTALVVFGLRAAHHSARNAAMGSVAAARRAGR